MLDIFGSIGRILPGYVEGQRNAITDNWKDLQNYNAVQQGQLANAFTEATFGNNVDMHYDARNLSRLNYLQSEANHALWEQMFPNRARAAISESEAWPELQLMQNELMLRLLEQGMFDPRTLVGAVSGGLRGGFGGVNNPPSVMR